MRFFYIIQSLTVDIFWSKAIGAFSECQTVMPCKTSILTSPNSKHSPDTYK